MGKNSRYDQSISIICATLFAIFSFLYIYLFQGELLALLQDNLSRGVTENNAFLSALLLTVVLMLIQWLINRKSVLHGRWEALSYIPSCLLLALLTNVNDGTMLYSVASWLWGVPLCLLLYVGVVWLERMMITVHKLTFFAVLWPNLLALSLLFVFTAQISNHSTAPHMELAAWRYMHQGKYERVLEVGARSDDYNAELTALRNLALAKTGQLGERLFHYPQPYGADGLIYNKHSKQSASYGSTEFYSHLGGHEAYGGEHGRAYAQRMAMKNDSVIYRDLYWAALLLDKDLDTFVKVTAPLATEGVAMPTHYQEAWLLYGEQNPDAVKSFVPDSAIVNRFDAYRALQREHADNSIVAANLCKRDFGDTYWCYYDY